MDLVLARGAPLQRTQGTWRLGSHCRTVLAAAPEKSCSPSLKPTIVAVLRLDSTLSTMSSGMPGFTRLTLKNSEPAETFAARRRSDRSTQRSVSPLSPHSDDPPATPPAGRRPSSLARGTRRQQRIRRRNTERERERERERKRRRQRRRRHRQLRQNKKTETKKQNRKKTKKQKHK